MAEDPAVWNDPSAAQAAMRERNKLSSQVEAVRVLERELTDTVELIELAEMEGDEALLNEAQGSLEAAQTKAARAELDSCCMMSELFARALQRANSSSPMPSWSRSIS